MGEEKKEEGKKEEAAGEIVLKVDMHCEACARKVAKALKGFEGVEEVSADCRGSRVVVKGKAADPVKVRDRLQKKSGKAVDLISPNFPQQEENKQPPPPLKEEKKDHHNNETMQPPPAPPAPVVTVVVLKVGMHCEACAQVIQKRIRKIQGVESVETELVNDQVRVKGVIEAAKLVEYVYKRTGKHASIVKEEEEIKKQEEEQEKKKEDKKEGVDDEENNNKEKEKGGDDNNKTEIKQSEYCPSKNYVDYAPHFFSDENPNACSLM